MISEGRMPMRALIPVLGLTILMSSFTACEREDKEDEQEAAVPISQTLKAPAWTDTLAAYLPALGHRNWIVVADSAFPLQISPGIETIVTNEDHFAVLDKVLKMVDGGQAHPPEDLARQGAGLRPGGARARRGREPAGGWMRRSRAVARRPFSTRSSSPASTRSGRPSRSSWSRRRSPSPTRRSSWSSTAATGAPRPRPRCARR